MEFKDYYKILGVAENADVKTIKSAYRKLAHKYHPDVNSNAEGGSKFKEIAEAYQVLKDKKLRAEFDELRKYNAQSKHDFRPPPGWKASQQANQQHSHVDGDFSEFFNTLFGGGEHSEFPPRSKQAHQEMKGQDLEIELPILLAETLKPQDKTIEFRVTTDEIELASSATKRLKVKVPKGVKDGERIRLKGQGKPSYRGGPAGDLYLHIRVLPHPLFDVQGCHLIITIPIAPWEAALGAKIIIPTLEGKIHLVIPSNTQSGDKLRVKGKGLQTNELTGDMLAVVNVIMPAIATEQGKGLWRKLAECEDFNPRKNWGSYE